MSTVGIVSVHFHPHYVAPTLTLLDRVKAGMKLLRSVHVANQESVGLALDAAIAGPDAEVVRHDNSGMEFGGYQAGLERLQATCDPDWVLVVNDTFATHDNFATPYRERLRGELSWTREHPAIVGQLESIARSYLLAGLRSHRWIRSSVYALNRAAITALGGRIYVPEFDAAVVETDDRARFFTPVVDPVLADHLHAWLFRSREAHVHWYGAEPLTAANMGRMARKARSILQEKYLSARLEDRGAEFADVRDIGVAGRARRTLEDKWFDARRRAVPTARTAGGNA